MAHSKEPWRIGANGESVIADAGGKWDDEDNRRHYGGALICESVSAENQRRIVACVNVCAGVPTEALERVLQGGLPPMDDPVYYAYLQGLRDARKLVVEFAAALDRLIGSETPPLPVPDGKAPWSDPFCPRHGRRSAPTDIPGLRCDCPEILDAAIGALKRGKWISAATMCQVRYRPSPLAEYGAVPFRCGCGARIRSGPGKDCLLYERGDGLWAVMPHSRGGDEAERRCVEDRGNEAVAEAILAGYELGLRGGVPPERVRRCHECGRPFLAWSAADDTPPAHAICLACFAEAT